MSYEIDTLLILIVIFQVKHFLADFPLQTSYMLRKVSDGVDWIMPLLIHCAVHALFTLIVCLIYRADLWWLAVLDFVVHFLMDRIKSSPHLLGRFSNIESSAYWNCLGFDQMVHHLTHLYIVWILVSS